MNPIGIVIIGRNEGERLKRCIASIPAGAGDVVYVDSGSTDGSVAWAQSQGIEVVELDMSRPFTAARARNAGLERLLRLQPQTELVQFVDGDCELQPGWLEAGAAALSQQPQQAAVCGRLRERCPEASIYNRLCDIEWNGPAGEISACGGIAMYRATALQAVGGFDESVVAGEEPELCLRLRRAGWKIRRLPDEMALHDAAMVRFGQWWKRAVRGGYAYALGRHMHGASPERHWVRQTRSNWFWGLLFPIFVAALAWPTMGFSLLLLAGYPLLAWRVSRHMRSRGFSAADARLYAALCVLSKFPQVVGQLRFWVGVALARPSKIIEHKSARSDPRLAQSHS
jgi:GT2 family glycosyltransferase